jgi:hypothetical protein
MGKKLPLTNCLDKEAFIEFEVKDYEYSNNI